MDQIYILPDQALKVEKKGLQCRSSTADGMARRQIVRSKGNEWKKGGKPLEGCHSDMDGKSHGASRGSGDQSLEYELSTGGRGGLCSDLFNALFPC